MWPRKGFQVIGSDSSSTEELPDIQAPMTREAVRSRRRTHNINWDQREDPAVRNSEGKDQKSVKSQYEPGVLSMQDVSFEDPVESSGNQQVATADAGGVAPDVPENTAKENVDGATSTAAPEPLLVPIPDVGHEEIVAGTSTASKDDDQMHDWRRMELFGLMKGLKKTVTHLARLRTKQYMQSDGELFSTENRKLASEMHAAGELLVHEGKQMQMAASDLLQMCEQADAGKFYPKPPPVERNPSSESETEMDASQKSAEPDKPGYSCHNMKASGMYLVGKSRKSEGKYRCSVCGRTFSHKITLDGHMNLHSGDTIVCPICKMTCTSYEHYTHHRAGHVESFECGTCGKKFQLKSSLYTHEQKHKGRKFQCNECDKSFTSKQNLQYHMKVHKKEATATSASETSAPPAPDTTPPAQPVKRKAKKRAVDKQKKNDSDRVPCGQCDSTFVDIRSLRTHVSSWHSRTVKKT